MQSVRNALRILALFKDHEGPLGVNDIAQRLGYEKSYVSRVLSAMRDMEYLVQDPATRKYTVGIETFALGVRYIADTPITRSALPIMREMTATTDDSVFLTIRHGELCRHILAVEGKHFIETRSRLGVSLPLHATAAGKILLAFAPVQEQEVLVSDIALTAFTPRTITTRETILEEIAQIRQSGLSHSRGELVTGLVSWGAPVYGDQEQSIAALSIIMPESVAAQKDSKEIAISLHTGARRLSSLCGARVYPH